MKMPYFDMLISGRGRGDRASDVFSRHVHWGLWPSLAQGYKLKDTDMAEAMERLDDTVIAGASPRDGQTVADIGCGFGGTLARMAKRLPNGRFVGVNYDIRQLKLAEPSAAIFLNADGVRLPLADDSIDAMTAVECIFHFPSRQDFLTEAERTLRSGSRVALSDFVPFTTRLQESRIGRLAIRLIEKGYGHLAGWPDGGYAEMAERAGLVLEAEQDVSWRTVPTYFFMLRMSLTRGFGGQEGPILLPTVIMGVLAVAGILRYKVVVLRKP